LGGEQPAVQSTLRRHNLSLVLACIAAHTARRGPGFDRGNREPEANAVSRADIAATTGITKATVSILVDRLIAGRLVIELPPASPVKAGRPATPLTLAAGQVAALGLEVNVDYVGARVVDLTGAILAERVEQTDLRESEPKYGFDLLIQCALDALRQLQPAVALAGSGLALPGLIDPTTGHLVFAPNLGWAGIDVPASLKQAAALTQGARAASLAKALANPLVHNEATLAAIAHATTEQDPAASFLYISGDVGIGAAVVTAGRPFGGLHGWAGEIGHVCVDPAGRQCTCGAMGCLETLAGKSALLRACGLPVTESVEALVDRLGAPTTDEPAALSAQQAMKHAGRALGQAVADAINLIDLNRVVLGGSLARLASYLAPAIEAAVAERTLSARWVDPIAVAPSPYSSFPAMSGAAMTVLTGVIADPDGYLKGVKPRR